MVMLAKKRQEKKSGHVVAKIRGDITDAQTAIRRAVVGVFVGAGNGRLDSPAPCRMFGMNLFGAVSGVELQREKVITRLTYIVRKKARALAIQSDGFLNAAAEFKRIAKIHVQSRVTGRQFHDLAEITLGGFGIILVAMIDCKVPKHFH